MSITQHDTIHYVAFPQNIISKKYTALVMTISHYPQANWKWAFLVWSLVIYFRSLLLVLYFPSNLVAVCWGLHQVEKSRWKVYVGKLFPFQGPICFSNLQNFPTLIVSNFKLSHIIHFGTLLFFRSWHAEF